MSINIYLINIGVSILKKRVGLTLVNLDMIVVAVDNETNRRGKRLASSTDATLVVHAKTAIIYIYVYVYIYTIKEIFVRNQPFHFLRVISCSLRLVSIHTYFRHISTCRYIYTHQLVYFIYRKGLIISRSS